VVHNTTSTSSSGVNFNEVPLCNLVAVRGTSYSGIERVTRRRMTTTEDYSHAEEK
jgi:hypothetical protein